MIIQMMIGYYLYVLVGLLISSYLLGKYQSFVVHTIRYEHILATYIGLPFKALLIILTWPFIIALEKGLSKS